MNIFQEVYPGYIIASKALETPAAANMELRRIGNPEGRIYFSFRERKYYVIVPKKSSY